MRKVSVIIPVKDRERALLLTLKCLSRTTPHEIILVDDGTTEYSVKSYADLYGIRYLQNDSGITGPYQCRKLGTFAATGDLVHFLDSDDFVYPGFYEDFDGDVLFTTPKQWVGHIRCKIREFDYNAISTSSFIIDIDMAKAVFNDLDLGEYNYNECGLFMIHLNNAFNPKVVYDGNRIIKRGVMGSNFSSVHQEVRNVDVVRSVVYSDLVRNENIDFHRFCRHKRSFSMSIVRRL